jgi:hypothetical protein
MRQPFEARRVNIVLGAERPLVERPLGGLIDQRALVAGERRAVFLTLQKILPDFGAYLLENETDMRQKRIVAQHGVPRLQEIDGADQRQRAEQHKQDHDINRRIAVHLIEKKKRAQNQYGRVNDKARLQRQ